MTTPDIFCLALIAVLLLLDYFVLWPTFLRQSHGNDEQWGAGMTVRGMTMVRMGASRVTSVTM
jgi:hypothetical protein